MPPPVQVETPGIRIDLDCYTAFGEAAPREWMIGGAAKNPRTSLTLGIAAFRNKICQSPTSRWYGFRPRQNLRHGDQRRHRQAEEMRHYLIITQLGCSSG